MKMMEICTLKYDVGTQIGDYTLLAQCGKGAYGMVFLAENSVTHQKVALKIIHTCGKNFERELKGLLQYQQICRKTNLLQIYHVGKGEDFFYYTMDAADSLDEKEYIPKTLANILQRDGKLQIEEIHAMAENILDSLKTLHGKGVMHRDIKPENILYVDGMAVLGDIGLITDHGQTTLAGTPGFMPAEVLAGIRDYETKDDFYALGKVLYCALTGLPVTQYPAFPASGTLTGAGKIIKLYTKLCAGEKIELPLKSGKHRKKWYIFGVAAMLVLAAGIFYLTPEPPESPEIPVNTPATPAQTTPETPAYQPSEAMLDLLPKLRKHYQQLEMQMYTAISEASKNISAEDIAEAEKYLAQHPEKATVGSETFAQWQKSGQAEAEFDRQHQNDPVWCYFRNQQKIAVCLACVNGTAIKPPYSVAEAREMLPILYRQQRELEAVILKKYQK